MTFVPFVQTALRTTQLAPAQWAIVVAGALLGGGWLEAWSALRRLA
jgi:hypothetical protein